MIFFNFVLIRCHSFFFVLVIVVDEISICTVYITEMDAAATLWAKLTFIDIFCGN